MFIKVQITVYETCLPHHHYIPYFWNKIHNLYFEQAYWFILVTWAHKPKFEKYLQLFIIIIITYFQSSFYLFLLQILISDYWKKAYLREEKWIVADLK